MEARGFYGILIAATTIGVALNFTEIDPVKALIWSAVINGVISVPIMAVMMLMAARPEIMGRFTVRRRLKNLGWLATGVMALAVGAVLLALLTAPQLLPAVRGACLPRSGGGNSLPASPPHAF